MDSEHRQDADATWHWLPANDPNKSKRWYYIAYFIWNETVWILAVAHGARRPEYWIERK